MVYHLTPEYITELDATLQPIRAKGLVVQHFGMDDLPMPKLTAKLTSHCDLLGYWLA